MSNAHALIGAGQPSPRTIICLDLDDNTLPVSTSVAANAPKKRKKLYYASSDTEGDDMPQRSSSSSSRVAKPAAAAAVTEVVNAAPESKIIDLLDSDDDEPEADPFLKRLRPSSPRMISKQSAPHTQNPTERSASSSSSSSSIAAIPGTLKPMPMTMEKTVFSAQLEEGLAALDRCHRQEQEAARALSKKKTSKAALKAGAGTGYGGVMHGRGRGAGGRGAAHMKKDETARQKRDSARARESEMDSKIQRGLETIRECIAQGLDVHSESTRAFLAEKLRCSDGFIWAVLMLLRNDDIGDIASRQALYSELFVTIRALSKEMFACSVLSAELKEGGTIESQLESLRDVASTYMDMQMQNLDATAEDRECKMGQMITDAWDSLQRETHVARQLGIMTPAASLSSSHSPTLLTLEQKYEKVMKPRCFRGIALCGDIRHYYFDGGGSSSSRSSMVLPNPQQRQKHISKELSNLAKSLPVSWASSIFVRYDDDSGRADVLKALIIGPSGTPYENGCFEFDILLPAAYPNVPPCVKLRTTGGGRVRFNPNLDADGKVCLSLLGTWEGEPWDPKVSTLLQVLISIQGSILVDDPYFNEPGYEKNKASKKSQSDSYSRRVQVDNMHVAVYEQLKNPSPGFEDVIKDHFYLKRGRVREQLAALAAYQVVSNPQGQGHRWMPGLEKPIGTIGSASDSTSLHWKLLCELDKLVPSADLTLDEPYEQFSGVSGSGIGVPGENACSGEIGVDDFRRQQRLQRFDATLGGPVVASGEAGRDGAGAAALAADSLAAAYDEEEEEELQRAIKMSMEECGGS